MFKVEIVIGGWATLGLDAARVRDEVFVREQQIPSDLEWDEADQTAVHAVAYNLELPPAQRALATGRLLADGAIGRMAVRRSARRAGVGGRILRALIEQAMRRGDRRLYLYAQLAAVPFYERHGFGLQGAPFIEAGIDHVAMARQLAPPPADQASANARTKEPGRSS